MKKLTVDRIEGSFAVCECEDLSHINISLSDLPFEVKEGNVLILDDNGNFSLDLNEEETMRQKVIALQNKLKSKNKK